MLSTPYLCAFYVATAGLQGASLGSDEEEIVLLIYVIIDVTQNKVRIFKNNAIRLSLPTIALNIKIIVIYLLSVRKSTAGTAETP